MWSITNRPSHETHVVLLLVPFLFVIYSTMGKRSSAPPHKTPRISKIVCGSKQDHARLGPYTTRQTTAEADTNVMMTKKCM
jgi:hypothetical protein